MAEDLNKDPQFTIGFGYNQERVISGVSEKFIRLALEKHQIDEAQKSADSAIKNLDALLKESEDKINKEFDEMTQKSIDNVINIIDTDETLTEIEKNTSDIKIATQEIKKVYDEIRNNQEKMKIIEYRLKKQVYEDLQQNLSIAVKMDYNSNKKVFGDESSNWSPSDPEMAKTLSNQELEDLRNAELGVNANKTVSLPGYYYFLKKTLLPDEEERLTKIFTDAGYIVACGLVFEFFGLDPLKFNINGFIEIPSLVPPSFNVDLCEVFRYLYNKKTDPNIGLALPRILGQFAGLALLDLILPKLKMPKFDLNISIGISVCDLPFGQGNCLPKSMTADYFENTFIPKVNSGIMEKTIDYLESLHIYRLLKNKTPEKKAEVEHELQRWTSILNDINKGKDDEKFVRSVYKIYSETQLKEKSPELFK